MFYRPLRGTRLRPGSLSGALLAVTGLLAGCDDTNDSNTGDAGADAGVGFISAHARNDAGGGIDTQDLSVGLDTSEAPGNLSVGLESFGDGGAADASASVSSAPELGTSAPTTADPTSEATSLAPVPTASGAASEPSSASSAPTSSDTPSGRETSTPVIDTSEASTASSEESSTAASSNTSAPNPLFAEIVATATWTDLPATFTAVELPDANLAFTWSVTSVPLASEVSDLALSDVAASEVSFVPDVAGRYTLNLHVASAASSIDVEASVEVAMVDVAFLKVSSGVDGGYVHEPQMVPTDGSSQPVGVGCSFDTSAWQEQDVINWRDALINESRSLGFRYPNSPGGETMLAYHYRAGNDAGVTHVATGDSDCDDSRPVDLDFGFAPDFSPTASHLSRTTNSRIPSFVASPIGENTVVQPTSYYVASTDWWDATSVAWAGSAPDGEAYSPVVAVSSLNEEGYATILDCAQSRVPTPLFTEFDEVAVVPGGLLVLANTNLWYLPLLVGDDVVYASCEYYDEANVFVASGVSDFEVAPNGSTVAFLAQQYDGEDLVSFIGVGPVGEMFEMNGQWGALGLDDSGEYYLNYYTGLHWVADSQQLTWTTVQYIEYYEGGYNFTTIYDSWVSKINADGTHQRTLAYNAVQEGGLQSVVTTGPIGLFRSYFVGE